MSGPVEILGPVEIPGWGQIGYGRIEDAVAWASYALETGGAAYALMHHGAELQRLVDMKIWRSAPAHDLLTKLRRMVLAEQTQALFRLSMEYLFYPGYDTVGGADYRPCPPAPS